MSMKSIIFPLYTLLWLCAFSFGNEDDRTKVEFFEKLRAHASSSSCPPPLGLHIVMGDQQAKKIQNLVSDIARNVLAPVELIARKTS